MWARFGLIGTSSAHSSKEVNPWRPFHDTFPWFNQSQKFPQQKARGIVLNTRLGAEDSILEKKVQKFAKDLWQILYETASSILPHQAAYSWRPNIHVQGPLEFNLQIDLNGEFSSKHCH